MDATSKEYTVTVNVATTASSDKEITRFYLQELDQEAIIDNASGTISIDYYKGYNNPQTIQIETSQFASVSLNTGDQIEINDTRTVTVIAQDGSTKDYAFLFNEIVRSEKVF